ncbi:hypothetical protein NEF87_001792 [Candidatus Lokiarchaeum ossiferum]|uniref:DUF3795 domain-containing protein n=1 Tax=Candidatus Lokiarchaeum ossiferum TaxID=2951803 RepID=A0ABY6HRK9_9ARCH|nr:hypothetical protein NEF87_001792 [Candidatus Lokiarchaeum sp. B-35]
MEKIIGYCGIVCSDCPAYIATMVNDDEARIKAAEMWSKEFNEQIKPEDINCEGCNSKNGVLFSHCSVCEMRKCGLPRNINNCAYCGEYTCQKLEAFHKMVPDAKSTLDVIKNTI